MPKRDRNYSDEESSDDEDDNPLMALASVSGMEHDNQLRELTKEFKTYSGVLPAWCDEKIPEPTMYELQTDTGAEAMAEQLKQETLLLHRAQLAANGVVSEAVYTKIISDLSTSIVERFRQPGGVNTIKKMSDGLNLLTNVKLDCYNIKNAIRIACESVILSAFCKCVKHPNFMSAPIQLMRMFNNFEMERTCYWRLRPAMDRNEQQYLEKKWTDLLRDLPALLKFYNAVQHLYALEKRYRMQHTADIASLTTDGAIYNNGTGRKISVECRLQIVKRICHMQVAGSKRKHRASSGRKVAAVSAPQALVLEDSSPYVKESAESSSSKMKPKNRRKEQAEDDLRRLEQEAMEKQKAAELSSKPTGKRPAPHLNRQHSSVAAKRIFPNDEPIIFSGGEEEAITLFDIPQMGTSQPSGNNHPAVRSSNPVTCTDTDTATGLAAISTSSLQESTDEANASSSSGRSGRVRTKVSYREFGISSDATSHTARANGGRRRGFRLPENLSAVEEAALRQVNPLEVLSRMGVSIEGLEDSNMNVESNEEIAEPPLDRGESLGSLGSFGLAGLLSQDVSNVDSLSFSPRSPRDVRLSALEKESK